MRGVLEAGGGRVRDLLCVLWGGEVLRHRLQGQGGSGSQPGVPDRREGETLLGPGEARGQGLQEGGSQGLRATSWTRHNYECVCR